MEGLDVANFGEEVIEPSHKVPVLVDFWAPWCGPCRVLGPTLDKLAKQSGGRWLLRKVNVDEHQDLAQEYHVKGIPAVKLFRNGKEVAEFTGALPEIQVSKWLKDNLPSENDEKVEQALLFFETGNVVKSEALLHEVLAEEPNHSLAAFSLGKLKLFQEPILAERLFAVAEIDPRFLDEAGYLKKLSSLLNSKGDGFPEHPVKPMLIEAVSHLSRQEFESAIEKLIEVIMRNKAYEDEIAREACIGIFYYLGEDHVITRKYRRRFDMALY